MQTKIFFPGSFDPITVGHQNIVERALRVFDQVVIGIGGSYQKKPFLDQQVRLQLVQLVFQKEPRVQVTLYQGATVDAANQSGCRVILRSCRNEQDFAHEKNLAHINRDLEPELETMIFFSDPNMEHISSSVVRELLHLGKEISPYVPAEVRSHLEKNNI